MPTLLSEHACFGGVQRFYQHDSQAIGLPMRFSIFLPPGFEGKQLPVLFYLAGLTCTEETFATKGGAQRVAAEEGLALVMPDTSPRGAGVAGETRQLGLRRGRRFLCRRDRGTLVAPLPHVQLCARTARTGAGRIRPRRGALRHLRPLDGRARRAGAGPAQPGTVPLGVGLCADRRALALPLGRESLRRLSRRRQGKLAQLRRQRTGGERPGALPARHPDRPGPGRQVPGRSS